MNEILGRIDSLLQAGDCDRAHEALGRIPDPVRDSYWSLLWALSDTDGMQTYVLLKSLLASDPPPPISCRATESLAEFHLMRLNFALGLAQINHHLEVCDRGTAHGRLLKLKGQHLLKVEMPEQAARALSEALGLGNSPRTNAETILALGDARSNTNELAAADNAYSKLTESLDGTFNRVALERLRKTREQAGDSTGAATLTQLLATGSPEALTPAAALAEASESLEDGAPTAFAVRVGEFARRKDASDLLNQFRESGYTVALNETTVGGTVIYFVDLGRFDSAMSAARFMKKLQQQTNASYQVVSL